nr:transposase (putative), gypsy type [Tanacetum cinerariifolium]
MGRDTIQLENTVSTISHEYLLEFTSEYGIPESLHPELPGPADHIVEFPEGKVGVYTKFFKFANFRIPISQFLFDILGHYQIHLSQLSVIGEAKDGCRLANDQGKTTRDMDLFSLISALNPAKVKTETRPRAAHEVSLLTATANRVIDMEDMTGTSGSSRTPSTVEKSPLDFSNEDPPPLITERIETEEQGQDELRCKRGPGEAEANAPPKVLRKDHVASHLLQSTLEGKSLAAMGIGTGPTISAPTTQETPVHVKGVSDPDPLSYAKPLPAPESSRKAVVTEDPDSEKSTSFTSMVGSPGKSSSSSSPMGLKDPGQGKTHKNLKALLEAGADMKDIAKAKNVELVKELESLRAQVTGEERIKAVFEDFKKYEDDRMSSRCAEMDARLYVLSIDFDEELYPHMLTAIAGRRWVIGHGLRLAIMKCAKSTELRQVFADVVSAGIAKGMSKGLKHGVEHEKAKVDLAAIEAYDPEADTKYVAALHALKDLKGDILEDAIAANISRVEKNNKYRVVYHTHGVGSAHHVRSDGIPVLVPTVAPQGLAILLADAATQTDITKDEESPKLLRSKSLPPMYNLDWP